MLIVNLTPHTIHLPNLTIAPDGRLPRCTEISESVGTFEGVELISRTYGEVFELPAPVPGTLYVVSALVRQALLDRKDLASPGDLLRDADGRIVGAKNLIVNT